MEGTTIYCGDNCNHTGPHRYPPANASQLTTYGTEIVTTHCKHGLDLRVHPRCYLCKPLETGSVGACMCYGNWWGVMPQPCPIHNPPTVTFVSDHT